MGRGYSAHRAGTSRQPRKAKSARADALVAVRQRSASARPGDNTTTSTTTNNSSSEQAPARGRSLSKGAAPPTPAEVIAAATGRHTTLTAFAAAASMRAASRDPAAAAKKVSTPKSRMAELLSMKRSRSRSAGPSSSRAASSASGVAKGAPSSSSTTGSTSAAAASAKGAARSRSATVKQRIAELEEALESELEESEDEMETVARPDVMTKYKAVGRAVDEVLALLAAACVPGAATHELCARGDAELEARLKGLFAKTRDEDGNRLPRGISAPTSVSVNEVLCNAAPLTAAEGVVLRPGDVVKLHAGAHLDGYPASAARTVVVAPEAMRAHVSAALAAARGDSGGNEEAEEEGGNTAAGRRARGAEAARGAVAAVEAARVALEGMIHLLQPGRLNADVTDFIAAVGAAYDVEALEGVLSHRTKRWVPDGIDCIIARRVTATTPQQDVDECEVGAQQVWTLDVAFTNSRSFRTRPVTAPGAAVPATYIFQRRPEEFEIDARIEHTTAFLKEVTDRFACFPFHLRAFSDPLRARMAIKMLHSHHGAIEAHDPLGVKVSAGDSGSGSRIVTTRFSATVAVTAKRVTVLCGAPPSAAELTLPLLPPPGNDNDNDNTGAAASLVRSIVGVAETNDTIRQALAAPLDFGISAAVKKRARTETMMLPSDE